MSILKRNVKMKPLYESDAGRQKSLQVAPIGNRLYRRLAIGEGLELITPCYNQQFLPPPAMLSDEEPIAAGERQAFDS